MKKKTKPPLLHEKINRLRKIVGPLGPLFGVFLVWARGVRDLRRLHDALDDDCRLLRDDLIMLDEIWMESNGGVTSIDGERARDEQLKKLLDFCRGGGASGTRYTLKHYYRDRLVENRAIITPSNRTHWINVAGRNPTEDFDKFDIVVRLKGIPGLRTRCMIDDAVNGIRCSMYVEEQVLTEPLTWALLNLGGIQDHPPRISLPDTFRVGVTYSWLFELPIFLEHFEAKGESRHLKENNGFLVALGDELVRCGLPVTSVLPYIRPSSLKVKQTMWFCEVCSKRGIVHYGRQDSDVISVARQLRAHHRQHSPECKTDDIRVQGPDATAEDTVAVMELELV